MFSCRAHMAMNFVRYGRFTPLTKKARTLLFNNASFTKISYSGSNLNSEKAGGVTRSNKMIEKNLETSKLYPDEWETLSNYNVIENFQFMDDNGNTSTQKGSSLDDNEKTSSPQKIINLDDNEKTSSAQKIINLDDNEKTSSAQKIINLDEPESIIHELETVEERDISFEAGDIVETLGEVAEKESDSDSESDVENTGNTAKYFDDSKSKGRFKSPSTGIHNVFLNKLPRKSNTIRSVLDATALRKNNMVVIDDTQAIFYLAKKNVLPKKIFFTNQKILSFFPASPTDVDLYKISYEDLKYWAPSISSLGTKMIALYPKEDLKIGTDSYKQNIPVTVVCLNIKHGMLLGTILYNAYAVSCKLFITLAGGISPWDSSVLRSSWFSTFFLNLDFNLSWAELNERIDVNDRVLIIPWGVSSEFAKTRNETNLPHVDLYDHNLWDRENITLIVGALPFRMHDEFLNFCYERKAQTIDLGLNKRVFPSASCGVVLFELRRQWLATRK